MDALDPTVRRALQVASYQRDELFHRSPNIIPPSLKMLVEPRPSERTMTLLHSINDEPFSVAGSRQPIRRQPSDAAAGEAAAVKAMTDLTVIAERVSSLRDKYPHKVRPPALTCGETERVSLDTAIGDCGMDSHRLQRVREYYHDILQHTAAMANPSTDLVRKCDTIKEGGTHLDEMLPRANLKSALQRVTWCQTELQKNSQNSALS